MLAALLLGYGRAVPLDELVNAVWETDPPATAEKQVRNAVSDLRRSLPFDDTTIVSAVSGYRLDAGAHLDAAAFQQMVERARKDAAESRPSDAVAGFRRALELWRGPALAGLGCPALEPQLAGLGEERLAAFEHCVELELGLGRHRGLTGELAEWANENPLRERLTEQLMLALHRAGAPAQAILAYERAQGALREELGVEPGPGLRRLRARILADDPALAAPESWVPRCDLPRDASYFTGRDAELGRILEAAGDRTGTTMVISALDGMAGVGKTTLAVHAARRLIERFPDAQLFIDLHAHTPGQQPLTPSAALEKLLRALGVANERIPIELEDRAALWRAQLAKRRALIVLDNAVDAAQLRPLLPGAPECLTIVTSRRRLTDLDADPITVDILPAADARELFLRVVGDDRPLAEPAATDDVLQLCGFLPLALRIAAARLRHRPSWTVEHLASRLRDQRHRLTELRTDNRSVATAFTLSYAQLKPDHQGFFRALGLTPGTDIDPTAAGALTEQRPMASEDILEDLVDAHLLEQPGPGRYRFHDLLRTYAARLAADTDGETDRRAALTRLFDHYLLTAATAMDVVAPTERAHRPRLKPPVSQDNHLFTYDRALSWLKAERANLLSVAGHAAVHGWPSHTFHLSATLWRFFHIIGNHNDALILHTQGLAAARRANDLGYQADSLASRGYINWWLGRYQEALADCDEGVRLAVDLRDRRVEGRALHALGLVCTRLGSLEEARTVLWRTLEAGKDTDDPVLEGYALRGIGEVYHHMGRIAESVDAYEQAISVARSIGNTTIEGYSLRGLAEVDSLRGDHDEALTKCLRALELARANRNRNIENRALRTLAEIRRRRGEYDHAFAAYSEALTVAEETANRYEEAHAYNGLAHTHHDRGDFAEARRRWGQAFTLFGKLGVPEQHGVGVQLEALDGKRS
ncbi:BTAD domain-containing putative transcriptional regulator [Amycolatopsis sp. NPDC058986]|uniref:AfsR/SARP family transcriptional regulator n=1 Tax=unclassified Amycolatopsis TaxID=2618356 RepID=UPI00366CCB47